MAEHLTPNGRAGIIVPEGIIFQSQTAYKQLRKMLVEEFLVAVVSLPAGVFNPYSGVKTSILILDKSLAKKADTIAFFKIENDGYGLGAQRRAIEKNDLPQARTQIAEYLLRLRAGDSVEDFQPTLGLVVPKEKIAANGDYNLSAERYREGVASNHSFPIVSIGEGGLFRVESGGTPKSDVEEYWGGGIPWATLVDLPASDFITQITSTKRTISEKGLRESSAKMIPANSVIVSTRATIGRIAINRVPIATNQGFKNVVIEDTARAVPEFVALALTKFVPTMQAWATGGTFAEISKSKFCELEIPLPPPEVQQELVAEIEGYQKVIDGARAVLDNYRPHIPIHPDWPTRRFDEVCTLEYGASLPKQKRIKGPYPVVGSNGITGYHNEYLVKGPTIVVGRKGSAGEVMLVSQNCFPIDTTYYVRQTNPNESNIFYLYWLLKSLNLSELRGGAGVPGLNRTDVYRVRQIPFPPLTTQRQIVAEIETEQALVAANRELITRFEKKIQATLALVWGEESAGSGVWTKK